MIKIFIYDDSGELRESMKFFFETSERIELAGEAGNCSNAIADMKRCNPDVVLMDINMPGVNGIDGLKKIKAAFPEIKILMQTVFDDSDLVFESIQNGASGYVLKKDNSQRLLQAIFDVYEGGAVMNPGIAQKVLQYFQPGTNKTENTLSKREYEVLRLLAEGMGYKMVANGMNVTYSTVKTYAKRIYEKLHVASLGEAIAYYYKNLQKRNEI